MDGLLFFPQQLAKVFLSPGSGFSVTSLAAALIIAASVIAWRRLRHGRPVRPGLVLRALFPGWMVRHDSMLADVGYFGFSVFVYGILFGWAVLSYKVYSVLVADGLTATFGAIAPTNWEWTARAVITLALFLAYEFGYWVDHYIKHRVPALWELHKVHHSANVLTPLTVWRLHPLDGLIFSNILGLSLGLTNGVASYLFGKPVAYFSLGDTNIILVLFMHITVHLQHTHLWIAFTGLAGRIFLSPAHHQIHHSNNPAHFDKNLGSCLAVFDWLFGTLHVPSKEPELLTFGVKMGEADMHSFGELAIAPVKRAAAHVVQSVRGEDVPLPEAPQRSIS